MHMIGAFCNFTLDNIMRKRVIFEKKNLIFAVMLLSPQTPQSFCVFRFHILILSNKSHLLLT